MSEPAHLPVPHALATARALYLSANSHAIAENFAAALTGFQTAALLAPAIPEFHFATAFAHSHLGQHLQAVHAYSRALALRPGFPSAWLNLGVELVADGRANLAIHCYQQALAASNENIRISALINTGHLHRSHRNFPRALDSYQQALALAPPSHPRHAEIQIAFAYLHLEQPNRNPQNFNAAWHALQQAEAAQTTPNPELPNARGILLLAQHANLNPPENPDGECLGTGHDFSQDEDADEILGPLTPVQVRVPHIPPQRLLTSPPSPPYGSDAERTPHIHHAIQAFQQAESLGHQSAASNRGNALLRLGRIDEALAAHQSACAKSPHHPGVRYNLALTQLRTGDFLQGWANYEIRWQFREVHPNPRRFVQPRWERQPLPPRARLLLYAEQGLGDTLQFLRYLPEVLKLLPNAAVAPHLAPEVCLLPQPQLLLEVQPPLTRLISHSLNQWKSPGSSTVIVLAHGDPIPPFTHHCPLMSLPAIFQTTLESIPTPIPYLFAQARQDNPGTPSWAPHSGQEWQSKTPRIGLNWAGNPHYRADRERSTQLQTFLSLLDIPNIQWISLQKGPSALQIDRVLQPLAITDACSLDRDLADTAQVISTLDLVISTDSAVAHLAAAMGKPLWLLLPWHSDWRWMQDRLTSPWYPHARLFRQASPDNWPELIDRVRRALLTYLDSITSYQTKSGQAEA